ncbi:MAG TPA: alpha/beta fold hydrolase [Vicinamibacterales bacterium]|nr:alpha/beta fold hydrolase [Vicinamibacterales bacterium]
MASLLKKHPLLTYYLLTFAISWGGILLAVGPGSLFSTNWEAEASFASLVIAMLAGPSISGLLLIGLVDGRAGYRDLFSRLRKWRVGIRWYAMAILPAPIVCAGVMWALSLKSPLLTSDHKVAIVLGGFVPIVTIVLEEIGWTGFAVPRLRRRYSVPMTGVIVGVLWALWHFLQQVLISGAYAGGMPQLLFLALSFSAAVASLTAYRVLLVWVFDRTGSLLVTTLMHGMLSASSIVWFVPIATGVAFLTDVWLIAAAMWLLVGATAAFEGWLATRGRTRPFRGADGRVLPDSVAEIEYLRLGGIDQWVMTRGEDVHNPLLIVLHGGPGMSETGFFRHYNAPLERAFIVVHWDQRGTGKSFDRRIPKSSMTVDRFVADLDELVEVMRRRFGKQTVAILGHSWGSVLGPIYAARYPEKVSVYVGAAQIGDWPAAEWLSYVYGLAEADRRQDEQALKMLRTIGLPPYPARSVFVERTALSRLDGQTRLRVAWRTARALFARPESSIRDLPNLLRGFQFTLDAMWAEVSTLNLLKLVPVLKMPVVIMAGRHDHWVPCETSVAYFNALVAPSKTFVRFEESGHEAFVDEPEKFNRTMVELVQPLAAAPIARIAPTPLPVSA